MPIQIANPVVVAKIERLAAESGLTKTGAVERAVDALLAARPNLSKQASMARFNAILAQFDRLPRLSEAESGAEDAIEWDENGLPR
jgi:antitoxin VapB